MGSGGTVSFVLAIVLLVVYAVVWTLSLIGLRVARNRYSGKSLPSRLSTLPKTSAPGVTIIRPLCGLDNNLFNALEAAMNLEYPRYEVIFALQDERDEALPVVKLMMEKYPHVDSRIIINDAKVGVNPKINNLMMPFAEAKYDLLWVIDATIAFTPGTLARAVATFLGASYSDSSFDSDLESTPLLADNTRSPPKAGDVGLVHHVPYAVTYKKSLGSLVEQAFLNTTHAKMYLAINALGIDSCIMGKSNLYSKSNIDSLTTPSPSLRKLPDPPTGLAAFSPFMAEDNMIGLSLWHELRLKHAMTGDVAVDCLGTLSLKDYIARRSRWIRVRKRMTPIPATMLEPFTESIFGGLCGTWATSRLFGASVPALWLVHMVAWLSVDLSVRRYLGTNVKGMGPPQGTAMFVGAWLIREVLAMPVYLYALCGDQVMWRGRRYRIVQSGEAICVDDHRPDALSH